MILYKRKSIDPIIFPYFIHDNLYMIIIFYISFIKKVYTMENEDNGTLCYYIYFHFCYYKNNTLRM